MPLRRRTAARQLRKLERLARLRPSAKRVDPRVSRTAVANECVARTESQRIPSRCGKQQPWPLAGGGSPAGSSPRGKARIGDAESECRAGTSLPAHGPGGAAGKSAGVSARDGYGWASGRMQGWSRISPRRGEDRSRTSLEAVWSPFVPGIRALRRRSPDSIPRAETSS